MAEGKGNMSDLSDDYDDEDSREEEEKTGAFVDKYMHEVIQSRAFPGYEYR